MRFITIVSLLVATAHVAVSAPVYSIARRDQGGIGAVIPSWNDVIQRDYNEEEDIHARQLATLLVRELLSDGPNGHFRRGGEDLGKVEGEDEDAHLKHIPRISLEPPEDEGIKGHTEHDEPNHIPNQVHEFLKVPTHAKHTLAESKASIHAKPK